MKIVKVTYTTNAEFAAQNQINIKMVMDDLHIANYHGIHYHVCICDDQKTFIHTAFYKSDEDRNILTELPSFKSFQEQLKASGLEVPPKQALLSLVGMSNDIF